MIHPQTIYTSRISYKGNGRIDITRKSKSIFGPSWGILQPVLTAKHQLKEAQLEYEVCMEEQSLIGCQHVAYELDIYKKVLEEEWRKYCIHYREEMADLWRKNQQAFKDLCEQALQSGIVMICFCSDVHFCHRRLLQDILIQCAPRFNMTLTNGGEII